MANWMKSADGLLKKAGKAFANAVPGRKFVVDNKNDPTSTHSMMMRKINSKGAPTKEEAKRFR